MHVRLAALSFIVATGFACAPSINPQMKAATDALVAQAKGSHLADAPSSYEPPPWKAGHWTLFRTTDKDGKVAVTRMSVVEETSDGIWVEFDQQDYQGRSITKVLYAKQPLTTDESTDALKKIITRRNDEAPQTIDYTDPQMSFMKSMAKSMTPNLSFPPNAEAQPKEDVTVPAGTFKSAAKVLVTMNVGPIQQRSTTWFHPAVPVSGNVKSVAEDGSFTYEVLDFGTTGATSVLSEK